MNLFAPLAMLKNNYFVKSCGVVFGFIFTVMLLLFITENYGKDPDVPILSGIYKKLVYSRQKAKIQTLDFFIPDFAPLAAFQKTGNPLKEEQLEIYNDYYLKALEAMPQLPEIYNLLGTFSYYMGNSPQAIDYYEKAINQDAKFFWPYYNLGLLLYKNGDIRKAMTVLLIGLKTDPEKNINYITNSLVFNQIFSGFCASDNFISETVNKNLADGYKNGIELINLGCFSLKTCSRQPAEVPSLESLEPKIF